MKASRTPYFTTISAPSVSALIERLQMIPNTDVIEYLGSPTVVVEDGKVKQLQQAVVATEIANELADQPSED